MISKDNIELRSEKVRNIIGSIPNRITRIGISVIFIIFLFFVFFAYSFKFNYKIEGVTELFQRKDTIYFSIKVPISEAFRVKLNQKVVLNTNSLRLSDIESYVKYIDSKTYISNSNSFIKATGFVMKSDLVLLSKVEVKATIYTDKVNLIDFLFSR